MADQTVWIVMFASADRSDISGNAQAFRTEAEAIEFVRTVVMEQLDGRWDDGEWIDQAEADREHRKAIDEINAMNLDRLAASYRDDAGDDYIQDVWVMRKTLAAAVDVSTPDKIEAFLGTP